MGIGGQFILGGLLQGAGKGITDMMQQRREDALIALRRQYQQEDHAQTRAETLEDYQTQRTDQLADKKELLETAGKQKLLEIEATGEQNRATRATDFEYDVKIEKVKSALEMKKDAFSKQLAAKLDGADVHGTEMAEDGSLIIVYKDGRREKTDQKLHIKTGKDDDEEGGTIAAARAARGGKKEEPKPGRDDNTVLGQLAKMPPPPDGQVGRTMTGPNGMKARWNGKTWVLVGTGG